MQSLKVIHPDLFRMALATTDQLPVSNNRSPYRHQHADPSHELTKICGLR